MSHQLSPVDNCRPGPSDLAVLRAKLHEDRQFRLQQLADIARITSAVVKTTSASDIAAHNEVRDKLEVAGRTALAETEAALARMDVKRYGRCGRCGGAISLQRLFAHPQARYCARCQLILEMQR
ncbi:TraR/DksA family transcriptional regulator [Kribbella rubisoli]|uniref:TraR/DksA family transcriptional regulator n=1 Tax=Kribbella rubisoli TaxID=3075929 RepID=A0A4Q7X0L0_9ACTN|nr:TraR/DksA C4-type zinc finger protein [Kribbella rubisoli]RZU16320.1 TraR/DksA family transcriptional regulator [Kribbella rubisoli]